MNQHENFIFHRDYLPDNESCNDEEIKEYLKTLIDCIFYLPVESWQGYINEKYKKDRYFKNLAAKSLQKFIDDKQKYEKRCNQNRENISSYWRKVRTSDPRKFESDKNIKNRELDW